MSGERPPAKQYYIRMLKSERRAPNGATVWYATWVLYQLNETIAENEYYYIADLDVPCRANLHKFLVGLLLDGKWDEDIVTVSAEQAKYLEVILKNQKEYKFWAEGLEVLKTKGKEEAWKWIEERIPLLKLKGALQ
jgi:hypothetical protein